MLFLTTKELAGASSQGFSLRIAKFVSVGILPLVMVFAVIAFMKIVEALAWKKKGTTRYNNILVIP